MGGWRKLHNKELHNLYPSPSIIRIIKSRWMSWEEHAARTREQSNSYRTLVAKPEGKRPLGRPSYRWVDNIMMDLRETGWDYMDCINLAQDGDQWKALANMVMNLRIP
jgi:hypothetical protein